LRFTLSKRFGESWCQQRLIDQKLFQLLEKVDADLTDGAGGETALLIFSGCKHLVRFRLYIE